MQTYNIKDNYIDKDEPCLVMLAAIEFEFISTENRLKGYSPGQLLFVSDVILPIKHKLDW